MAFLSQTQTLDNGKAAAATGRQKDDKEKCGIILEPKVTDNFIKEESAISSSWTGPIDRFARN